MTESPATSQAADLTAQTISSELQLAQLQRDRLALELEVLKLRTAAAETKFTDGADSSKSSKERKKRTASALLRPQLFLRTYPLRTSLAQNSIYLWMTLLQQQ